MSAEREGAPPHRPDPEACTPECTDADHIPPRVLVTLHYPLEMGCVGEILGAVAKAYPGAVIGENGQVLGREADA